MATTPQTTPSQLLYSWTQQFKEMLRAALIDFRVAAPAIVQSFDPATQTVSVQIAMTELVRGTKGPVWTVIPPINRVPICIPRGGGFSVTLPIKAGDEGLLVFADTMFDLWWLSGGTQPPAGAPVTQPQHERRRHDVTDCIFIPGIWNQTRLLSSYSNNSVQVRSDSGTVVMDIGANAITLTAPTINLNATTINENASGNVNINASKAVVASSNNTSIDGRTFLLHEHTGVQTGAGNTGPVL